VLLALLPVPYPRSATSASRNVQGIHVLTPDSLEGTRTQLGWARLLVGPGGYVTQPFSVGRTAEEPPLQSAGPFVEQAYAGGLNPILMLQSEFANRTACNESGVEGWLKPAPDPPGASDAGYSQAAEAYQRFVAALPRMDDRTLYVQIGNEPNLDEMWGGAANPAEYARFFVDVSAAIRSIGDSRIKVLNAALSPEGNIDNLRFIDEAIQADPRFTTSFDYWASHPYPHNQPPANNLHDGSALPGSRYAIDAYLLELDALRRNGVDTANLQVMLTETGYDLGDAQYGTYPPVDEENRADYIRQAFATYWSRWPEIRAVTPFELAGAYGSWQEFDWVWPNSSADANDFPTRPHLQYARLIPGTGIVVGTVRDEAGNALKDVSVTTDANGHRALTHLDGSFVMLAYPGTYRLVAEKGGYRSAGAGNVAVTEGGVSRVSFTLPQRLATAVQNGSFETGDLSGWTPWGDVDGVQQGSWYVDISAHDAGYFLGTAANCGEKEGGVYQSIAVPPGKSVQASVWALTYKEGASPMGDRVGLDPDGGTNPESGGVVWSPWLETGGRGEGATVSATSRAGQVTIFLQHAQDAGNVWNINAFDGLEVTIN
jgi:hypothetical protein